MKNPWMSMWLSAANKSAGAMRGFWTAEAQRQQQAFLREMTKAWTPAAGKRRKPSSRDRQK